MYLLQIDEKMILLLVEKTPFFNGVDTISLPEELSILDSINISNINFPIRFKNAIYSLKNITSLLDLLNTNYKKFLELNNCGLKSVNDARQIILSFIKGKSWFQNKISDNVINYPLQEDDKRIKEESLKEDIDLIRAIEKLFSSESKRNIEMIKLRWYNTNSLTYSELGTIFNLSRERVRQIFSRIIHQLNNSCKISIEEWRDRFIKYLIKKPQIIKTEIFEKYNLNYSPLLYFNIFKEIFEEVPFDGSFTKSFEQKIKKTSRSSGKLSKIIKIIEESTLLDTTPVLLVEKLKNAGLNVKEQLLCFKIILGSKKYLFYRKENDFFLIKRGPLKEMVYSILIKSKHPLNIKTILEEIICYYGKSKYESINSVIGIIKQDERIIQFDRYDFGLEKHFTYQKDIWQSICFLAKNFLREQNRQCYVTEILDVVKKEYPLIKSKYELVSILRTDNEIRDLGFFNFTLSSFSQEERIKVSDSIKNIFNNYTTIKHLSEIREELKHQRFIRDEGIGCILRIQDFLKEYPGGFFGLREFDSLNKAALSKNEKFINYLISKHFFPNTELSVVINYFEDETLKKNMVETIQKSDTIKILSSKIVLDKEWSSLKIAKCLLFNSNEGLYEEELRWFFKDLDKQLTNNDFYKIRNDSNIRFINGKYSIINKDITLEELSSVIDDCYNFIKDSSKSFSLQELFNIVKNYLEEGIEFDTFALLVKEDDRFVVTSNDLVLIK